MTRRGFTPYFTDHFVTGITMRSKTEANSRDWEPVLVDFPDLEVWETRNLKWSDFLPIDVTEVELTFSLTASKSLNHYFNDPHCLQTDFSFNLLIQSSVNRVRKSAVGTLSISADRAVIKGSVNVVLSSKILCDGLIVEPVLTTKREIKNLGNSLKISVGTIVGWSNPLVFKESSPSGSIESLFDFRWIDFMQSDAHQKDSLFDVDWESEPVVWLNEGIIDFKEIMTTKVQVKGKQVPEQKAREIIDTTIASNVLQTCATSVSKRIRNLGQPTEDGEPVLVTEIVAALGEHEKELLYSWWKELAPNGLIIDEEMNKEETCRKISAAIVSLTDVEFENYLIKNLPSAIRAHVGLESAASLIMALAGVNDD